MNGDILLQVSTGGATGTVTLRETELADSILSQKPLVWMLQQPEAPMPNAKTIKKATMKQEQKVAEDLGGRRQKGSGALDWKKGDGRVRGKYRIENKMRFTKGITITRSDLEKIRSECSPGEVPLFEVDFANKATCKVEDQWILIPYDHWKKVLDATSDD